MGFDKDDLPADIEVEYHLAEKIPKINPPSFDENTPTKVVLENSGIFCPEKWSDNHDQESDCGYYTASPSRLIAHLNDVHRLTFEEIAGIVEYLKITIEVIEGEMVMEMEHASKDIPIRCSEQWEDAQWALSHPDEVR